MLPGSICSGSHSVTMFSSATTVTSGISGSFRSWMQDLGNFQIYNLRFHIPNTSRTSAPAWPARCLFLRRTPVENLRSHFAHGIAQANSQQRLPGVLEDVDH